MIRTLALFAALSLCAPVASAQVLGDRVEASGCAFSAGGNVTDNSINLICGMPFEEVAQMVVGMSSNDPAHKCVFHDMWPPVPRACGQSFHDMWPHP